MRSRMIKKKIFDAIWKHALQARFLTKQNASQAGFLDQVLMGTLSYWYSM